MTQDRDNEFATAYLTALQQAAHDVAQMKEAHARGEDLVLRLPSQVGDKMAFSFIDDLPSRAPDNDAWDVEFSRGSGWSQATFKIWFASSQNMGGDEPETGWVTWVDGDLLIGFVDENGPFAGAIYIKDASPFEDDDAEEDPHRWVVLARTLLKAMFSEIPSTERIGAS